MGSFLEWDFQHNFSCECFTAWKFLDLRYVKLKTKSLKTSSFMSVFPWDISLEIIEIKSEPFSWIFGTLCEYQWIYITHFLYNMHMQHCLLILPSASLSFLPYKGLNVRSSLRHICFHTLSRELRDFLVRQLFCICMGSLCSNEWLAKWWEEG